MYGGERSTVRGATLDPEGAGEEDEDECEPISDVCTLDAAAHFWVTLPMDGASLTPPRQFACSDKRWQQASATLCHPSQLGCARKSAFNGALCRCHSIRCVALLMGQCLGAGTNGGEAIPARAGASMTALTDGRGFVFGAPPLPPSCLQLCGCHALLVPPSNAPITGSTIGVTVVIPICITIMTRVDNQSYLHVLGLAQLLCEHCLAGVIWHCMGIACRRAGWRG